MLEQRCHDLLLELGLIDKADQIQCEPLTGGVASDIAKVDTREATLCVKFALPKLKVAADWFAPVHRNAAEYAWLEFANSVAPDNAVKLYGHSPALYGFAMEYINDDSTYLWKDALLKETKPQGEASKLGVLIAQIHNASAKPSFSPKPFSNADDFKAIRLEPYLDFTATQHEQVAERLRMLSEQQYTSRQVLVHGDVSPKNIVFRQSQAIILDAECANMGDGAFDLAFCLNHLILKAIHLPASRQVYFQQGLQLWQSYAKQVVWDAAEAIEQRVSALLPAFMLARVDGKSPVEYLDEKNRSATRTIALELLASSIDRVDGLLQSIANNLTE